LISGQKEVIEQNLIPIIIIIYNKMTWTVLHEACQNERKDQVIQRSSIHSTEAAMTDDHGWTPLHIACLSNPPVSVVLALMQANPSSLAEKDIHGNTPLHIAAANSASSMELMECLLKGNSVPATITNKEGLTPLHMACRFSSQNEALVRVLTEAYPRALRMRIKVT
jgi:ankyrin repeat protein